MGSGKETLAAPLSEVPLPPGDAIVERTRTQDVLLVVRPPRRRLPLCSPPPLSSPSLTAEPSLPQFSISLMMIVSIMSNQSITIALPVLGRELGIDRTDLQWPVTVRSPSAAARSTVFC